MNTSDWNPEWYLQFEKERSRPCFDLLAAVGRGPASVLDVGCGPGNSAGTALARWPEAEVTGIDSSPAMVEAAAQRLPAHRWETADMAVWEPGRRFDLVLSNAAVQWLPDHARLLERLAAWVAPGGTLAVQIPRYAAMPVAQMVDAIFAELAPAPVRLKVEDSLTCESAAFYAGLLGRLTPRFEVWETFYHHRMPHHRAIVDMLRSTGLRPYLDRLPREDGEDFEAYLLESLPLLYPAQEDGSVLFPFQRLFFSLLLERSHAREARSRESAPGTGVPVVEAPAMPNTRCSTSATWSTRLTSRSARTSAGSSFKSFSFNRGSRILRMPARCAAMSFSLMPPTGITAPRRVTSPVMARLRVDLAAEDQAGQSGEHGGSRAGAVLGNGPRRNVHVQVGGLEVEARATARPAGLDQREGDAGAFLHHVAELAGQDELARARHRRRFEEEDVAAHGRPRQTGRRRPGGLSAWAASWR